MGDRSGSWADDTELASLLAQRIETVLGLRQWILEDADSLAAQLHERLNVDELHELVQLARKARDEKLAVYHGGRLSAVPRDEERVTTVCASLPILLRSYRR